MLEKYIVAALAYAKKEGGVEGSFRRAYYAFFISLKKLYIKMTCG